MKRFNFIPASYRQAQSRRRMFARCAVLLVVMAACAGWWVFLSRQRMEALDERLALIRERVADVRSRPVDPPVASNDGAPTHAQMQLLSRLAPSVPTVVILSSLADLIPDSIGLHSISIIAEPVNPGSDPAAKSHAARGRKGPQTPAPIRIIFEGVAPNDLAIARFIGRLDQRPLFVGVKLGYARPTEGGDFEARMFQVTAEVPLDRNYVIANHPGALNAD